MDVEAIKKQFREDLSRAKNAQGLQGLRVKYLGRKGELTKLLRSIAATTKEKRAKIGRDANELKMQIEEDIKREEKDLASLERDEAIERERIDVTLPGGKPQIGHLHPITIVERDIENIFSSMGFEVAEGPEVETPWYNFDALNIPPHHPARDMWDTFWIDAERLLRTHTSPMQIRTMELSKPPLRVIVPGKVYRHDASDSTHDIMFHQLEGFMVGSNVSAAHFKYIIEKLFEEFFQRELSVRLRPSFFPFVEPGWEIDISDKEGKWLEVAGAGMIHPQVLRNVGYDPDQVQGFAFGFGIDRLAMLRYGIDDIRLFYSGDLRFLRQFS